MDAIENPDADLLEDPEIINLIANNDPVVLAALNSIRRSRTDINRGNVIKFTVITIHNKKQLKNQHNEIQTIFQDLLRDQDRLKNVFYNQNLPKSLKNRAADLLEIILGIEPNSGLLVELRDLKNEINKSISRIHSRRKSSGGNPKKKNRKSIKRSKTFRAK